MPRSVGSVDAKLLSDRYEILAPLGAGTAATVYRVRDRRTGVLRAAKVLTPENAANPKILARFEDEFRILRTLHHPHLPEVYDYGWTEDGGRFLVMELVDGVPLDEYFRSNPSDIWAILYELCETLTFIHNHKLLHQDIKPSNILVKRTTAYGPDLPLVKLIDFGLMYRRDTGAEVELVGTPEYIAPEVARGNESLTRAVDYYSLGVTLYELLVGHPPFQGPPSKVLRAHVEQDPVIENEELEWAELYPHVYGLLSKKWTDRLNCFESFSHAVTSRLTGGIDELKAAYTAARASRTVNKGSQWEQGGTWLDAAGDRTMGAIEAEALDVQGPHNALRNRLVDTLSAEAAIRGFYVVRLAGDAKDVLQADNPGLRQVERFERTIARMRESHCKAVLLIIDGIEQLTDEPASFIRYLSTKRELATQGEIPILFAIARRWRAPHLLDSYLPSERKIIDLEDGLSAIRNRYPDFQTTFFTAPFVDGDQPEERRRLLTYVASHPRPVPIAWARVFVGSSDAQFANDLDHILTLRLASKVNIDGVEALLIPEDARAVALSLLSEDARADIHRDLATRLTREVTSDRATSATHNLIAHHLAAIGEHRAATVAGIRAVRAAWQERSLSEVERLAQASLERLDQSAIYAPAARRHFVKQWVSALWAKNQHTRAKAVIDEHIVAQRDSIPPALLPKYVRGILDADGPAPAMEFLNTIDIETLSEHARCELQLERALLLCQTAKFQSSLDVLEELAAIRALIPRDVHRITIYRAMNLGGLGEHARVGELLDGAIKQTHADGCIDEFVLMSAIRAQALNIQGQPYESLQMIARTLRIAHKNELYLRINLLYRLSAAAYQDLGQPWKSIVSQRKAIALFSALGLPQFEAMSWSRLADYERVVGNLGNTLRYLNKARRVIATTSFEADHAKLDLATLQLHLWLRSPELESVVSEASWVERTSDVNQRGRYFMLMGDYWTYKGNWTRASDNYENANALLRRTGYMDYLVSLSRAQLRLSLQAGAAKRAAQDRHSLTVGKLKRVNAPTSQLERALALLEFDYHTRAEWDVMHQRANECLRMCNESTEAFYRLEALLLVFRVFARCGKYSEAEAVFGRMHALLKSITSNLGEQYVAGIFDRLDFTQLWQEVDLVDKRKKAGDLASLVA